jgi:hypothetical protein
MMCFIVPYKTSFELSSCKANFTSIFEGLLVVQGDARQGPCRFRPIRNGLGGGFALEFIPDVRHEVEEENSAANVNGQR